jgi:DNA-3-methyladenine glycosylase
MAIARIGTDFFSRDVLIVAPELIGKNLCRRGNTGFVESYIITEVEAYRGTDDLACHASKGRTPRTEVMFGEGGHIYVYLIYGMYWMLNFVTGQKNDPQAVLIRGLKGCNGPGKLTRLLGIDKSFYGEDLSASSRIWVEETGLSPIIETNPRIGVDYAGAEWASKPWRFTTHYIK